MTTAPRLAYALAGSGLGPFVEEESPLQSSESLYGRVIVAVILILMVNFFVLFGLMALGLSQGFRITW